MDAAAVFPDVTQDELMAAPANYTIGTTMLLENERVRVWDITLGPGERMPFHCHRTTYFYRCESGGRWRLRTTEGEVLIGEDAPGEVTFHELAPGERLVHELTNVGDCTPALHDRGAARVLVAPTPGALPESGRCQASAGSPHPPPTHLGGGPG